MNIRARISDGLQSLATRMGTGLDKRTTASYAVDLLEDGQLEAAFRTSWVARKVVTLPSMDATRRWRQWSGDSEKVAAVEEHPRIMLRSKVQEAYWKGRLYGGAAVLIGVADPDFSEPLVAESVRQGDLRYLAVLSKQDLMPDVLEDDPREERFGKPRHYNITTAGSGMFRVHPSRLVEFRGNALPRWNSGGSSAYGWGDSVLQSCYDACRNLDSTMANVAALVFDAKTDVVKIPGLTENITDPAFEEALLMRFATARMLKGNHGTLILDAEESYESRSYTFSGLDAIADRFMQVVSGAADVPMTRLLGTSPGGLNSTGDGDLANYYDNIEALQSNELEPALSLLDRVVVRSALGHEPADVTYSWRPLRQMTEQQVSEIRGRNADTVSKLATSGVYSEEAVAEVGAQLFNETGVRALSDALLTGDQGGDDV